MTVEELKKEKRQLDKELSKIISEKLCEFKKKTDMSPSNIRILICDNGHSVMDKEHHLYYVVNSTVISEFDLL